MIKELILKFPFLASHSLSGYEEPHMHRWTLKISVTGQPIEGRIIDLVQLQEALQLLISPIEKTYLNTHPDLPTELRSFPTVETLSDYFYQSISTILKETFLPLNPTICLNSVQVTIYSMEGEEFGAAKLSRSMDEKTHSSQISHA